MPRLAAALRLAALLAAPLLAASSFAVLFHSAEPVRPLAPAEEPFVGKWRGQRGHLVWEIERFADKSFELALVETDRDDPHRRYRNYAAGRWWVNGHVYYFEWTQWTGDEGDFAGVVAEPIDSVTPLRIVTLSPGEADPRNVEQRVSVFSLPAWNLKP